MAAFNADHVFSQIVTIAKSNASELELRRRAARRIEQFMADVARSPHPLEIGDRNKKSARRYASGSHHQSHLVR